MSIISTSSILSASGHRRINAFAGDELADTRHDLESLFAEEKVDKGLARVGMRRLWSPSAIALPSPMNLPKPDVIQRHAFLP